MPIELNVAKALAARIDALSRADAETLAAEMLLKMARRESLAEAMVLTHLANKLERFAESDDD